MNTHRPRWVVFVSLALAIAGVGISGYLTIVHYSSSTLLACVATGVINCERVTTSAQSQVVGIPVALLGLGWFLTMVVLCSPWAWRSGYTWLRPARLVGVAIGMMFVLWLVYAELFVIRAICLWCTVVHAITFALFVIVVLFGTETANDS